MKKIYGRLELYEVEEEMPCSPSEIRLGPNALAGVLDDGDMENAAAWLLSFSQAKGRWIAVANVRFWRELDRRRRDYRLYLKSNRRFEPLAPPPDPNSVRVGLRKLIAVKYVTHALGVVGGNEELVVLHTARLVSIIKEKQDERARNKA